MTWPWFRASLSCALLFIQTTALRTVLGEEGPPPILNPRTYTSASGEYALRVDPSDLYGRDAATYRLTKAGIEVWSGTRPLTLWEAGVTDTGVVAGYSYSHGWRGFSQGGFADGMGEFQVVILDAGGNVRLNEITSRQPSRYLHSPPNPIARGLIVDEPNDRMVVRVADSNVNRSFESWWVYQLSTGTARGRLQPLSQMPNSKNIRHGVDAKPVLGTPLTLVHWWYYEPNRLGARFTLVDLEGKPVWTLDLNDDYTVPGNARAQQALRETIREEGAILRCDVEQQFDLRVVATSERVRYAVRPNGMGGWKVSEVGRVPYAAPASGTQVANIEQRPLKPLGPLVLQSRQQQPIVPIRSVKDFVTDDQGRLAFLRRDDDGSAAFVLVNDVGTVIREMHLVVDDNRDAAWTDYAWVGGDQFVVTRSVHDIGGMARAWLVDAGAETEQAIPLKDFASPAIDRLTGFSDGGFVALATEWSDSTLVTTLRCFAANGKQQWALDTGASSERAALFSPKDVAVTSTGEIAVVDVIRHVVQIFDRRGKFRRAIDLEKAWGRAPNYPSGIAADVAGGFIVDDFNNSPPLVRMRPDGKVRASVHPKHPDGRVFHIIEFGTTANGRLWTCDGHALLRLNDQGVVDRVLGAPPQTDAIGNVAGITIDRHGHIYAVDGRTGAVHVFDGEGKQLRICRTMPTDFSAELWDPAISTTDDGQVFLSLGDVLSGRAGDYLQFSAAGERLGIKSLKSDRWCWQPTTGNGLALDYEHASLVGPTGKILHTVTRRPDGNWLERPQRAAMAPDGAFAIVAHHAAQQGVTVNLYSRDGDPLRTIALPHFVGSFPNIAYDGQLVAAAGNGHLVFFDTQGTALQRCLLGPEDATVAWHPFFIPTSGHLLLFDGKSGTLLRYERPRMDRG